jgi:uncharacterized protein YggE
VGEANGTPDQCVIDVAFEVIAEKPSLALDEVSRIANNVIEALRERGAASDDIQTKTLKVKDQYDRSVPRLDGPEASYQMTIRAASVEEAGPLLSLVSEVAGDSLHV